jgi:hypothetical protein
MKAFQMIYFIVGISTLVTGQIKTLRADQDSVLIKQLVNLEFTLDKLLDERDFNTYETYLADDYTRISANGKINTKDEVLKQFQSLRPGAIETTPEILQVRVYGNTAILNIHITIKEKELTRESLLTKVFILCDGNWIMVSNQGTALH